jgi:Concanavalin A-like lectin/glucanases superfamily
MPALVNPYWYAAGDPNFANVVLLCHFDGTNGSTTFIDSSSFAVSLSQTGAGRSLTTAQQQFGTASLASANDSGTVQGPIGTAWQFGAGQFTVEAFVRPTSALSGVRGIVTQWAASTNLGWFLGFNGNTLNFFYSTTGTDNPAVSGAYTPTLNSWVHIAADRDVSNVLRVYANGAVIASSTVSATFFNSTQNLRVSNDGAGTRGFVGQIDEVRITKGVARYGGAFTPPTVPFLDS